jgi:hypothetical protein
MGEGNERSECYGMINIPSTRRGVSFRDHLRPISDP